MPLYVELERRVEESPRRVQSDDGPLVPQLTHCVAAGRRSEGPVDLDTGERREGGQDEGPRPGDGDWLPLSGEQGSWDRPLDRRRRTDFSRRPCLREKSMVRRCPVTR
ncbi:hypothetical protein GCM10023147_06530 [Tsukamurella soli]|uniref:Uncharacterized protein n=1 Tax=Tsukamurella soli TaxID=644556 RepID=A0ABP8J4Y4_9ACTN